MERQRGRDRAVLPLKRTKVMAIAVAKHTKQPLQQKTQNVPNYVRKKREKENCNHVNNDDDDHRIG